MASVTSTLSCAAVAAQADPSKRTLQPIVTGTSVLAIKYKGGIMMAADTLGSYGSLARFNDVRRIVGTGEFTIVGADGDFSDFQHIQKILKELETEDKCVADGIHHSSREIWSCLTRILYHRRSKMDPLWNNVVVGGMVDGEPFLGTTDKIGTSYQADFIATGLGLHMAMPVLRRKWKADMSENEAKALLEDCLRVLIYRDCRTLNRISFAKVTKSGINIEEPRVIDTEWSYQSFIDPSR